MLKVFYITNSILSSRNANTIQTTCMRDAFSALGADVFSFWLDNTMIPSFSGRYLIMPAAPYGAALLGLVSALFIRLSSFKTKNFIVFREIITHCIFY